MSKAIEGAALIGAGLGLEVLAFALASSGVGIAALPFLTEAGYALATSGVAMEIGAAATALFASQGSGYTVREPAPPRQIIYGEQRVGGVFAYLSTTGSELDQNNFVIVIAGHSVECIENLYLDGRQVFWAGGGGNVNRGGVNFGGAANSNTYTGPGGSQYNFGGLVYCEARYGDQTLTEAGPDFPGGTPSVIGGLTANDPIWAASGGKAPVLMGCTYVYLKLEYDTNMFPNTPGQVEVKFTVRGKNDIWDPRTGTKSYSTNPALIVSDVILDTQFGLGDVDAFKDAGSVAQLVAAANICDEEVAVVATGSNEARYGCHYHYDTSVAPGDAVDAMLKSMGARISMPGGEWYIYPTAYVGASASFGPGDLSGGFTWNPTRSLKDLFNRVTGTYIAANWPWNTAGNLYDANGFFNGTIQNNFDFGFEPTNFPQYAADPLHGYAADAFLEEDSQLIGAWDGGTGYGLGDVVSKGTGASLVMYKSLIAGNVGNDPATSTLSPGPVAAWAGGTTYAAGVGVVYVPATWVIGTTYAAGQTVAYGGLYYISLAGSNLGNEPDISPAEWAVFSGLYVSLVGSNTGNEPDTSPSDWTPAAWVAYSNLLPRELTLRSVLSVTQAQRLAKIELMRNRYQGMGTLSFMQRAFAVQVCDVITMNFPAMNWAGKTLEILGVTISTEYGDGKTAPLQRLSLQLAETDPSIYDWDPELEELDVYGIPASAGTVYAGYPASPPYTPIATPVNAYTQSPSFVLTQPTATTIAIAATTEVFGNGNVAAYAARTVSIPGGAPGSPTWLYVTIEDPTQRGESGTAVLTVDVSTTNALAGVPGNTYVGAILALPAGSATRILPGGWPAPSALQVGI